jgi:hypothetical protein
MVPLVVFGSRGIEHPLGVALTDGRGYDEFKRQAIPTVAKTGLSALDGCEWRGKREPRHNKLEKHRPTKHPPNRSTRVA